MALHLDPRDLGILGASKTPRLGNPKGGPINKDSPKIPEASLRLPGFRNQEARLKAPLTRASARSLRSGLQAPCCLFWSWQGGGGVGLEAKDEGQKTNSPRGPYADIHVSIYIYISTHTIYIYIYHIYIYAILDMYIYAIYIYVYYIYIHII